MPVGKQGFTGEATMKRVLCGALVAGAALLGSASTSWADDEPAKTTTPASTSPASTTPAAQTESTTPAPTTQNRTRGLRGRRNGDQGYQRSGRFSNFMANLRSRRGR
jgi:hypothetical protein